MDVTRIISQLFSELPHLIINQWTNSQQLVSAYSALAHGGRWLLQKL